MPPLQPSGDTPLQAPLTCPFGIRHATDYEQLSRFAADTVLELIRRTPDALLILATGASPARTYELLAAEAGRSPDLFRQLRILKLDEWGGLHPDDPASCETFLRQHLADPLGIGPDRFVGFNGRAENTDAECERIRDWLTENGPADACVLGLGLNGHLGLNEPADSLALWPHRAELAPETLRHDMLRTARTPPTHGLTLGMGDILNASQILLLVSGASKRQALARLLQPEISPQFPASMLWLHRNVMLIHDAEAFPWHPSPSR